MRPHPALPFLRIGAKSAAHKAKSLVASKDHKPAGRSWVVGVGTDYPQHVWHKQSYASLINWDAR